MTPDPTPTPLQAIRERLSKATPGPWSWWNFHALQGSDGMGLGFYQEASGSNKQVEHNMELIAHAPTDLAYLLDALAQAKKECALLKMQVDAMAGELPRAVQENLERAVVAEKHLAQVTQERDEWKRKFEECPDCCHWDYAQKLQARLALAEAVVEAAENILGELKTYFDSNHDGTLDLRSWDKYTQNDMARLQDALTAFRQGRAGG